MSGGRERESRETHKTAFTKIAATMFCYEENLHQIVNGACCYVCLMDAVPSHLDLLCSLPSHLALLCSLCIESNRQNYLLLP